MADDRVFTPTLLTAHDRDAAADLLTEVFFDNPGHTFIYPDAASRREQLRWLMYANLGAQLAVSRSFAEKDAHGNIAAMGFWRAPGTPKATREQLGQFGFLEMPVRHGQETFTRMVQSFEELEKRRMTGLGGRESWFLNNMVVSPAYQGTGVGTRLLREQLERVVDPSGYPASLTTQKPQNVSFYRRLGFQVTDDRPIGSASSSFPNWIMIYG